MSEEKLGKLSSVIMEHLPKDNRKKLIRSIVDKSTEEGVGKGIVLGIEN